MEAFRPNRPTGSTPEARFAQAQWDRAYGGAHVIRNSKDVQVSRTTQGIFLKARRPRRAASTPDHPFKIKRVDATHFSIVPGYVDVPEYFPETTTPRRIPFASSHRRLFLKEFLGDFTYRDYTFEVSNPSAQDVWFEIYQSLSTPGEMEVSLQTGSSGERVFRMMAAPHRETGVWGYVLYVPIGSVAIDGDSVEIIQVAIGHQMTNVHTGQMRYRGLWNSNVVYFPGDVVDYYVNFALIDFYTTPTTNVLSDRQTTWQFQLQGDLLAEPVSCAIGYEPQTTTGNTWKWLTFRFQDSGGAVNPGS